MAKKKLVLDWSPGKIWRKLKAARKAARTAGVKRPLRREVENLVLDAINQGMTWEQITSYVMVNVRERDWAAFFEALLPFILALIEAFKGMSV